MLRNERIENRGDSLHTHVTRRSGALPALALASFLGGCAIPPGKSAEEYEIRFPEERPAVAAPQLSNEQGLTGEIDLGIVPLPPAGGSVVQEPSPQSDRLQRLETLREKILTEYYLFGVDLGHIDIHHYRKGEQDFLGVVFKAQHSQAKDSSVLIPARVVRQDGFSYLQFGEGENSLNVKISDSSKIEVTVTPGDRQAERPQKMEFTFQHEEDGSTISNALIILVPEGNEAQKKISIQLRVTVDPPGPFNSSTQMRGPVETVLRDLVPE